MRLLKIWGGQRGFGGSSSSSSSSLSSGSGSRISSSGEGGGDWTISGFENSRSRSTLWTTLISALVWGEEPLVIDSKDENPKPKPKPGMGMGMGAGTGNNLKKRIATIPSQVSSYQLFRAVMDLLGASSSSSSFHSSFLSPSFLLLRVVLYCVVLWRTNVLN